MSSENYRMSIYLANLHFDTIREYVNIAIAINLWYNTNGLFLYIM